ncbi:hypothetical protein AS156_24035 [Bradyrhizobium macuxiense]|uniref:Uncharacterized protein n=2 Tax=Bradyrhizobium macuxiense TaxID=1755647 RepID=A0A109J8Y0_9BRAD|nr:hypothetical protein AS156_24035 [Bradyrhizobium macuxiense]
MLGEGIRQLHERKIIDERLYEWSQSLHAIRNMVAHPEDISVSRDDAEDLQVFVNAITEYVYDLSDRYEEFKERQAEKKKPRKSIAEMFGGVLPTPAEQQLGVHPPVAPESGPRDDKDTVGTPPI